MGGHLEVLKWARKHGCPWDVMTCAAAALGGHLEILQWARANGAPWDVTTCAGAATNKRVVLKWAREHGCPWNKHACNYAATPGKFEILKWAHGNGCPCDMREVFVNAAKNGHPVIMNWARARNGGFGLGVQGLGLTDRNGVGVFFHQGGAATQNLLDLALISGSAPA
jgi:hypothetical protein